MPVSVAAATCGRRANSGPQHHACQHHRRTRRNARRSLRAAGATDSPAGTSKGSAVTTLPPVEEQSAAPGSSPPPPPRGEPLIYAQLSLAACACLWGTYAPALRFILMTPGHPDPATLTAVRSVMAAAALLLAQSLSSPSAAAASKGHETAADAASGSKDPQGSFQTDWQSGPSPQGGGPIAAASRLLSATSENIWVAGAELGLYNFIATQSQTLGLQTVTSTRAGFLIQATCLFTPVLAALSGDRVSRQVWGGVAVAVLGTSLVTIDKASAGTSFFHGAAQGDLFMLGAAFFYAVATLRLSKYAQKFQPVRVATAKTISLACVACVGLGLAVSGHWTGWEALWPLWRDARLWLLVAYSALGPGALAAYLQTRGQSRVPPSQSQVIFCLVPLFSAFWGVTLLHEPGLGALGWVGGIAILIGGYATSLGGDERPATAGSSMIDDRVRE